LRSLKVFPCVAAHAATTMRVAFFCTCLVDLFRPAIGLAALDLLAMAGIEPEFPAGQTCCGQPAYNAGDRRAALALAKKFVAEFEGFDHVVIPSGSCAGTVKTHYAQLLRDEPDWLARYEALRPRLHELSEFLVDVLKLHEKVEAFGDGIGARVTYHDSCSGLRELGIKQQPRTLLAKVPGLELAEMAECESCCGFGGTFSLKFGEISAHVADAKCEHVEATGAQAVVLGDLGCMLNIEGRLRRRGDECTQVLHFAQVLTGRR
jgi:L-lactate dehydrogenase complex protein LldE